MKELTIEQKARAYDEAIEKGKQIQNTPYTAHWNIMKEVAEHLLPELRESEDERIRKALMQNLKERFGTKGNMGKGLDMPDVLAWLEKQGEQKSQRIVSAEAKEAMYDKPAWSEEDEKMLKMIIKSCEQCGNEYAYYWLKSIKDRVQPQLQWKPSKEMLEALYRAIPENTMAISKDEMLLDELYQGLKYGRVLSKN